MEDKQVDLVMKECDEDGDGCIDELEFVRRSISTAGFEQLVAMLWKIRSVQTRY